MISMYARSFPWGREMWVREYKKSVKWPSTALSFSFFFVSNVLSKKYKVITYTHTYQISLERIAFWQITNLIVLEKIIAEYSSTIDLYICHHDFYMYAWMYVYVCAWSCPFFICRYATFSVIETMNYIEKVVNLFINRLLSFYLYLISYAKFYLTG